MLKLITVLIFLLPSISVIAANTNAQQSINEFSIELSKIYRDFTESYQASIIQPYYDTLSANMFFSLLEQNRQGTYQAFNSGLIYTIADDAINTAINELYKLKTQHDKNKYIKITGFGFTISIPPSLTIKVDFK